MFLLQTHLLNSLNRSCYRILTVSLIGIIIHFGTPDRHIASAAKIHLVHCLSLCLLHTCCQTYNAKRDLLLIDCHCDLCTIEFFISAACHHSCCCNADKSSNCRFLY